MYRTVASVKTPIICKAPNVNGSPKARHLTAIRDVGVTNDWFGCDLPSRDLNLTFLAAFSHFCRALCKNVKKTSSNNNNNKKTKTARGVRFKSGLDVTVQDNTHMMVPCRDMPWRQRVNQQISALGHLPLWQLEFASLWKVQPSQHSITLTVSHICFVSSSAGVGALAPPIILKAMFWERFEEMLRSVTLARGWTKTSAECRPLKPYKRLIVSWLECHTEVIAIQMKEII